MKIGFLITARLKSTRLKLKLLLPLNGKTVIEHVIDRAKAIIDCDDIVLCTSKSNQDLPLVKVANKNNIYYFNGHSEDVLKRLLDACILFNFDFFIGITADNPLFSIHHANLITDSIKKDPTLDFVYTSGLPIGVNIYGISVKALKTVCAVKEEIDTEIWGPLINRPDIFNVFEIRALGEYAGKNYRMTLDEHDDYRFFKEIYQKIEKKTGLIDVLDVFQFLEKNPNVVDINLHVKQIELKKEIIEGIQEYYKKNKGHICNIKNQIYSKS
jgi:spore coat polysaccharide biosynthesis protein SpsF